MHAETFLLWKNSRVHSMQHKRFYNLSLYNTEFRGTHVVKLMEDTVLTSKNVNAHDFRCSVPMG